MNSPQTPPDNPGPGPGGPRNSSGPDKSGGKPSEQRRSIMPLLLIAALIGLFLLTVGGDNATDHLKISLGKFQEMVRVGLARPSDSKLKEVTRYGDEEYRGELIEPETFDGREFRKFRVEIASENAARELTQTTDTRLATLLSENFTHQRAQARLTTLLITLLPWILIFGMLWFLFFRRMGPGGVGGAGGLFGFTRSRAKMHTKETVNVTFKDVAGIDEAREDVAEIIQFLKNPEKFRRIGGRIPRGVLLVGPPGCGKTLLAKAIAGEAGVPFFSISGSDFVEMFVGVGASRVRDLFRQAKDNAPCIIFLDEIDAVGRRRGTGLGGGHDEREQTLNAILVEMDGFDTEQGIIVVAATNRPDVLDPALLRPGRFDRQITIDLPDIRGREKILEVHMRRVKRDPAVDIRKMARGTPGFSGAELANLVNEAAIISAMNGRETVDQASLEDARDKVRFGREKKSRVIPEKELKVTAYHEAGHAVVQHFMPQTDPIHKVTIIPRGMAAGATMSLPEEDRHSYNLTYLTSLLAVFHGGRIAERVVFNDVTTGASNDIKRCTEIARRMVCEWGMSEKVGPLNYSDSEEHMFLGREVARTTNHGEEVTREIDAEVRRLVRDAEEVAERIMNEKRDRLDVLAEALLEFETLLGEEILPLLDGEMTLDELRQSKPRSPRRIITSEEAAREDEEAAKAAAAHVAAAGDNGSGSASGAEDGEGGGGLPVPKSLGDD